MTDNIQLTRAQLIKEHSAVPKTAAGLRNWVKKYDFPKPRYLNPNCPIWNEAEVAEWFESRPRNHYEARGL